MTTTFKLNVAEAVISDKTLNTDADATAVSASSPAITKNDANVRQFYVSRLFPTLNTGGLNATTTIDILNINTTNTAVTGVTTNLLHLLYGNTSLFKFGSAGDLLVGGSAGTSGHFLKSNGAGAAVTWAAAGGSVAIGDSIGSATAGSVLFAGVAGVLAQDNAKLFWDNGNDRLGIGNAAPTTTLDVTGNTLITYTGDEPLAISHANATAANAALKIDGTGGANAQAIIRLQKDGTTYGNIVAGTRTDLGWVSGININAPTTSSIGFRTNSTNRMTIDGSGNLTFGNGTFATGTGNVTFDTDTLVVDATNNRVGIGTTGPARALDVRVSGATSPMQLVATSTNGFSAMVFCDTAAATKASTGYGQSATASPYTSTYYFNAASAVDTVWLTNGTERLRMSSAGVFTFGATNVTFDTSTLAVDAANDRVGIGQASPASPLDILPVTVTTQATNYISGIKLGGTYTKNDGNIRQFYVQQIKPTFAFGGSNTGATTVDILSIDSTNTTVTGLTANLINAKYGGTSKFKVDSGGEVTTAGTITVGNSLVQSGDSSAMEMKGWAANGATAIGAKFGSGNNFTTNGAILMQIHNQGVQKAAITKTGAYNPDFTDDSGTTGDRTVNKPCGKSAFGAGATAITITNNCVKTDSIVFAQLMTNDSVLLKCVEISDGSFIIRLNGATGGTVVVGWIVFNGN
jgi:hypothetical protein